MEASVKQYKRSVRKDLRSIHEDISSWSTKLIEADSSPSSIHNDITSLSEKWRPLSMSFNEYMGSLEVAQQVKLQQLQVQPRTAVCEIQQDGSAICNIHANLLSLAFQLQCVSDMKLASSTLDSDAMHEERNIGKAMHDNMLQQVSTTTEPPFNSGDKQGIVDPYSSLLDDILESEVYSGDECWGDIVEPTLFSVSSNDSKPLATSVTSTGLHPIIKVVQADLKQSGDTSDDTSGDHVHLTKLENTSFDNVASLPDPKEFFESSDSDSPVSARKEQERVTMNFKAGTTVLQALPPENQEDLFVNSKQQYSAESSCLENPTYLTLEINRSSEQIKLKSEEANDPHECVNNSKVLDTELHKNSGHDKIPVSKNLELVERACVNPDLSYSDSHMHITDTPSKVVSHDFPAPPDFIDKVSTETSIPVVLSASEDVVISEQQCISQRNVSSSQNSVDVTNANRFDSEKQDDKIKPKYPKSQDEEDLSTSLQSCEVEATDITHIYKHRHSDSTVVIEEANDVNVRLGTMESESSTEISMETVVASAVLKSDASDEKWENVITAQDISRNSQICPALTDNVLVSGTGSAILEASCNDKPDAEDFSENNVDRKIWKQQIEDSEFSSKEIIKTKTLYVQKETSETVRWTVHSDSTHQSDVTKFMTSGSTAEIELVSCQEQKLSSGNMTPEVAGLDFTSNAKTVVDKAIESAISVASVEMCDLPVACDNTVIYSEEKAGPNFRDVGFDDPSETKPCTNVVTTSIINSVHLTQPAIHLTDDQYTIPCDSLSENSEAAEEALNAATDSVVGGASQNRDTDVNEEKKVMPPDSPVTKMSANEIFEEKLLPSTNFSGSESNDSLCNNSTTNSYLSSKHQNSPVVSHTCRSIDNIVKELLNDMCVAICNETSNTCSSAITHQEIKELELGDSIDVDGDMETISADLSGVVQSHIVLSVNTMKNDTLAEIKAPSFDGHKVKEMKTDHMTPNFPAEQNAIDLSVGGHVQKRSVAQNRLLFEKSSESTCVASVPRVRLQSFDLVKTKLQELHQSVENHSSKKSAVAVELETIRQKSSISRHQTPDVEEKANASLSHSVEIESVVSLPTVKLDCTFTPAIATSTRSSESNSVSSKVGMFTAKPFSISGNTGQQKKTTALISPKTTKPPVSPKPASVAMHITSPHVSLPVVPPLPHEILLESEFSGSTKPTAADFVQPPLPPPPSVDFLEADFANNVTSSASANCFRATVGIKGNSDGKRSTLSSSSASHEDLPLPPPPTDSEMNASSPPPVFGKPKGFRSVSRPTTKNFLDSAATDTAEHCHDNCPSPLGEHRDVLPNGSERSYVYYNNASALSYPAQSMKHVTHGGYVTLLRDTRQILIKPSNSPEQKVETISKVSLHGQPFSTSANAPSKVTPQAKLPDGAVYQTTTREDNLVHTDTYYPVSDKKDPQSGVFERTKTTTVIRAPHHQGIGPVDESGLPCALRSTVDDSKHWYKNMFKQMHAIDKNDDGLDHSTTRPPSVSGARQENDKHTSMELDKPKKVGRITDYQPAEPYVVENKPIRLNLNQPQKPPRRVHTPKNESRGTRVNLSRSSSLEEFSNMAWTDFFDDVVDPKSKSGRIWDMDVSEHYQQSAPATQPSQKIAHPVSPKLPTDSKALSSYTAYRSAMSGTSQKNSQPSSNSSSVVKNAKQTTKLRQPALVKFDFTGQTAKELTMKKGQTVIVTRRVDDNWYMAENMDGSQSGIVPVQYIELISPSSSPDKPVRNGSAKGKFDFTGKTKVELSFKKGDDITLLKKVDANWYKGKIAGITGIVPSVYIDVIVEPDAETSKPKSKIPKELMEPAKVSPRNSSSHASQPSQTSQHSHSHSRASSDEPDEKEKRDRAAFLAHSVVGADIKLQSKETSKKGGGEFDLSELDQVAESLESQSNSFATDGGASPRAAPPSDTHLTPSVPSYPSSNISSQPSTPRVETPPPTTTQAPVDSDFGQVIGRYVALYPYEACNEDELDLVAGDVILVVEVCDDGWFVGTCERSGAFGTFPGNYAAPTNS